MLVGLWYGCLFRFPVLYLWLVSSAVGLMFALGGVFVGLDLVCGGVFLV